MCYIQPAERKFAMHLITLNLLLTYLTVVSAKVMDFGPKLPEFVEEHTDKSWLIKFYAPWCYHCQQLEPTFLNVAEKIYHKHDNLVVGRVDCTKYPQICEKYQVRAYPTIIYLNHKTQIPYRGDRTAGSLIDFAERLNGPEFRQVDNCTQLKSAANQHGLIVVGVGDTSTNNLFEAFRSLASKLRSNYWFYHIKSACNSYIDGTGVYIIKQYLQKPIKFQANSTTNYEDDLIEWIKKESFPIFSQLSSVNFDRALASNKLIAVAVVDEYKPARKLSQPSKDFLQTFEKIVKKNVQLSDQILYTWSSDTDLLQSVAIGHVPVPNVMLLKSDYSYHILIKDSNDLESQNDEVPDKLHSTNVETLLQSAISNKLTYQGGNSLLHNVLRHIYSQFNKYTRMYSSNPLLASVLIGFPSLILLFVIYTTCCYKETSRIDDDDDEEEDEENSDEERLVNHIKQD